MRKNVGTHTPQKKTQRLEACFPASIPSFFEAEYAANHSADLAPKMMMMIWVLKPKLYPNFLCNAPKFLDFLYQLVDDPKAPKV